MPHNFDFSKVEDVKTIRIDPQGWVNPLYVEYGIIQTLDLTLNYYWRVKGTLHTFVISVSRMDFLSAGDYKKFFEYVLEVFREDYLSWKNEGFITEWSKEYEQQFSRFIVI